MATHQRADPSHRKIGRDHTVNSVYTDQTKILVELPYARYTRGTLTQRALVVLSVRAVAQGGGEAHTYGEISSAMHCAYPHFQASDGVVLGYSRKASALPRPHNGYRGQKLSQTVFSRCSCLVCELARQRSAYPARYLCISCRNPPSAESSL